MHLHQREDEDDEDVRVSQEETCCFRIASDSGKLLNRPLDVRGYGGFFVREAQAQLCLSQISNPPLSDDVRPLSATRTEIQVCRT